MVNLIGTLYGLASLIATLILDILGARRPRVAGNGAPQGPGRSQEHSGQPSTLPDVAPAPAREDAHGGADAGADAGAGDVDRRRRRRDHPHRLARRSLFR